MKLTLFFAAALLVGAACSLLPDRVYFEAKQSPLSGTAWQDVVEGDDPLLGVGIEWDLKPTRVLIQGQREAHPWDFGSMLGIYDGADDKKPQPITVTDEALTEQVRVLIASNAILASKNTELTEQVALLSGDLKAVRETSDMLKSILVWLTAGGGATLASLLGVRAIRRTREPQISTEEEL